MTTELSVRDLDQWGLQKKVFENKICLKNFISVECIKASEYENVRATESRKGFGKHSYRKSQS